MRKQNAERQHGSVQLTQPAGLKPGALNPLHRENHAETSTTKQLSVFRFATNVGDIFHSKYKLLQI